MMADNLYKIRGTKGDPIYQVIEFIDEYGNPFDLTDLQFSIAWKYAYGDVDPIFAIDFNDGMGFVDDDPTLGQVYIDISGTQTELVEIDTRPKPGITIPYTQIVGDVKIIYIDNQVATSSGTRVKIFATLEAATA